MCTSFFLAGIINPNSKIIILKIINGTPINPPIIVVVNKNPMINVTRAPISHEVLISFINRLVYLNIIKKVENYDFN